MGEFGEYIARIQALQGHIERMHDVVNRADKLRIIMDGTPGNPGWRASAESRIADVSRRIEILEKEVEENRLKIAIGGTRQALLMSGASFLATAFALAIFKVLFGFGS